MLYGFLNILIISLIISDEGVLCDSGGEINSSRIITTFVMCLYNGLFYRRQGLLFTLTVYIIW